SSGRYFLPGPSNVVRMKPASALAAFKAKEARRDAGNADMRNSSNSLSRSGLAPRHLAVFGKGIAHAAERELTLQPAHLGLRGLLDQGPQIAVRQAERGVAPGRFWPDPDDARCRARVRADNTV